MRFRLAFLAFLAFLAASQASAAMAPELALKDLSGARARLSDFRGRPILLDFWAPWCDSCAEAAPFYEKLSRDYRDRGLSVLGIAEDSRAKDIIAFVKKNGMTYRILLDEKRKTFNAYHARGLPTAILIDGGGHVLGSWTGFDAKTAAEIKNTVETKTPAKI